MHVQSILILDDHPAWYDFLQVGLRDRLTVTVETRLTTLEEAKAELARRDVDLLIIDVRLPDGCGLAFGEWVQQCHPSVPFVILSAFDEDAYLTRAYQAGARGYLLKEDRVADLAGAVLRALDGEMLWTPEQAQRIRGWQRAAGARWATLTEREQEVVQGLAGYQTDAEIGAWLQLSPRTVNRHLSQILSITLSRPSLR